MKLAPEIRKMMIYHLSHYEKYKKELATQYMLMIPSPTAQLTGMPSAGEPGRTTENIAIRIADNAYIIELVRRINAIEYVLSRMSKEDRSLIEMCYIRKSHTVQGAAIQLHMSERSAYYHCTLILTALAEELAQIPRRLDLQKNCSFRG